MKKLFTLLAVLGIAATLLAQATYTIPVTAGQDAIVTRARLAWNAANAGQTFATNELFFRFVGGQTIKSSQSDQDSEDNRTACIAWRAATQAQRNSACAAIGLGAGCVLCP